MEERPVRAAHLRGRRLLRRPQAPAREARAVAAAEGAAGRTEPTGGLLIGASSCFCGKILALAKQHAGVTNNGAGVTGNIGGSGVFDELGAGIAYPP